MDTEFVKNIQYLANQIIADGYKSICFWMPCFNVSGGARYFRDLAVKISNHTDLKVYYVDFANGFPSSLLSENDKVEIIEFNADDLEFPIKEPTIICTNSTKVIQLKNMNPLSKLLFWHFETIPCAWDWLFFNHEERKFIRLTKNKHAMIYHDWSGRDILSKQFNIKLDNRDYLQVYSMVKSDSAKRKVYNSNEINLVWLSRLGSEKICSLYNIIDNFAKYKTNRIKRLHIVGDGIRRDAVELYCKKYKEQIEFIFLGTIDYDKLADYLLTNADIVFAMGTSVIESAALKIPSVVVQLSSSRFTDDAYYWLFDAKEYCVGITTEEKQRYNVPYRTMENLLNAIDNEEKSAIISDKCNKYFIENHSNFNSIVEKFLKFAKNTELSFNDLKKVIVYTPYNIIQQTDYCIKGIQLYSRIKFGDKVYIKLLGIPIKTYKLNNEMTHYTKWGVFRSKPIIKKFINTKYKSPDNQSSSEHTIKIGKLKLIKIVKNKKLTKYFLFNKIHVLTKRENIGYNFPQSLFRG